jgi:hypothetical protein
MILPFFCADHKLERLERFRQPPNPMPNIFWDFQIFLILALALFFCSAAATTTAKFWPRLSNRQKILRISLGVFSFFLGSVVWYASFFAPYQVIVNTVNLKFQKTAGKENIRIVQISDLHSGFYKDEKYFAAIANRILEMKPDLVFMTGDFISHRDEEAVGIAELKPLTTTVPTFAVLGNHEFNLGRAADFYNGRMQDKSLTLRKIFQEINVTILEDTDTIMKIKGGEFQLTGLKDIWIEPDQVADNLKSFTEKNDPALVQILLAHNPDIILNPGINFFDLTLAGHTHGGQLRLPIIGSIKDLPTRLGRAYDRGLFTLAPQHWLYVNEGLGESGPRSRLFCPPEITLFNIDL